MATATTDAQTTVYTFFYLAMEPDSSACDICDNRVDIRRNILLRNRANCGEEVAAEMMHAQCGSHVHIKRPPTCVWLYERALCVLLLLTYGMD